MLLPALPTLTPPTLRLVGTAPSEGALLTKRSWGRGASWDDGTLAR